MVPHGWVAHGTFSTAFLLRIKKIARPNSVSIFLIDFFQGFRFTAASGKLMHSQCGGVKRYGTVEFRETARAECLSSWLEPARPSRV